MNATTLRLILGDQLNAAHSWFSKIDDSVVYLVAELRQETDYVRHHVQKVSAFFLAMASFADRLKADGHRVMHLTLDDTCDFSDLPSLITHHASALGITSFEYQLPDEYRLRQQLAGFTLDGIDISSCSSEHFLVPDDEIKDYFPAGKRLRMENFYRKMRVRYDILMAGGEPQGGSWNYDAANRNKLKKSDISALPVPLVFTNDATAVLDRLQAHGVSIFGTAMPDLPWPIDEAQAEDLLSFFCEVCLPQFGTFQDAMTCQSKHAWSLYHSRLSFAINAKILHPMRVIEAAITAYEQQPHIDIAQAEGFVRQILGWREFVRGIYWANMPGYASTNGLEAERDLPGFFWTGETKMLCLQSVITQSLDTAYAHHIQRLMVTGNFSLLAGIHPDQVDEWYLGIYVDALEWVEMPNTRGMSQFADDGLLASKPYAASANYMNKMSDYCASCHYNAKGKTQEDDCPFNSLYWAFMEKHRDKLANNPRIGMVYRNWDKQDEAQKAAVLDRAEYCLNNLDKL